MIRTTIARQWQGEQADIMLALHAGKSAGSAMAWVHAKGTERLALVLTGTDVYRDIQFDLVAQQLLRLAGQLVVLQECAPLMLPKALQHKVNIIHQSALRRTGLVHTGRHLRAVMVGHLRAEKDPLTFLRTAARLARRPDILLDHIGNALDPLLGLAAQAAARDNLHYRWLGAMTHEQTRSRIQRAHVLVHPSKMEGGAQVIVEAVQSGTPVLASRIDGNVGMLGQNYAGYFALGDDAALAQLLQRCRDEADFLPLLRQQCAARAPLFDPQRERALLRQLAAKLLAA
jgi:putative glycosyltransferase (TIGR04348 family)